jgi:arylsulfatase A-like enzyme
LPLYTTTPDLDLNDANLFGVTPTLLDLMGVNTDDEFDGESLLG